MLDNQPSLSVALLPLGEPGELGTELPAVEVVARPESSYQPPVDALVRAWLEVKFARTNSERTRRLYADGIASLRCDLAAHGLDLDSATGGDARPLAFALGQWVATPRADGAPVAATTYNLRLAVVGSFYAFALRRELLTGANPVALLERRPAEAYAGSRALDFAEVAARMGAIDRRDLAGRRDYALLALTLQTGRRLAEVAALRVEHLTVRPGWSARAPTILVRWPRAKGDKHLLDDLPAPLSVALLDWLAAVHGRSQTLAGELPPDQPLWTSLAHNGTYGRPLSPQAIEAICLRRLGTTKVHALRHTFAHAMEHVGAKVSDIQARLGHSSLQTTSRYLAALRSAENAHAADLALLLGLTGKVNNAATRQASQRIPQQGARRARTRS